MIKEIDTPNKLIGLKQTMKGLRQHRVAKVLFARDADPQILEQVRHMCDADAIPMEQAESMQELGKAAGIAVGAAVISLLKE